MTQYLDDFLHLWEEGESCSFGGERIPLVSIYVDFLFGTETDPGKPEGIAQVARNVAVVDRVAHKQIELWVRDVATIAGKRLVTYGIEANEVSARQVISDFLVKKMHRDDTTIVAEACTYLSARALERDVRATNEPGAAMPAATWRAVRGAADLTQWTRIVGYRSRMSTISANTQRASKKQSRRDLLERALRSKELPVGARPKIVNAFYRKHGIDVTAEVARTDLGAVLKLIS